MELYHYFFIVGGIICLIAVIGYVWLVVSFMGLPHKCKYHGWTLSAICHDCDDEMMMMVKSE